MLDRIGRLWRSAGTGFAFAVLFGGGAILALTAFPLTHLVTPPGPKRRERNQWLIHWMFRLYVWMVQALRIIDLDVVAAERLRQGSGRMIVANHPSLLDVVLLMALVPRAQCIVKSELWSSPYLGNVVRGTGYIRNDLEPEALLDACRQALAAGNNLIIFPEGTRTVPGEPMRLRRGFANIATLLEMELQLVTITCSPPFLIKGDPWWVVPSRRPRFRVEAGQAIDAKTWLGDQYRSLAARKLVRFIEQYYAERLAHG